MRWLPGWAPTSSSQIWYPQRMVCWSPGTSRRSPVRHGTLAEPTKLVAEAHAAALLVHPYTFRAENQFLPATHQVGTDPAQLGRALAELDAFLRTGIDGFFTDEPDLGVLARQRFLDTVSTAGR
jgi:glycerophosphoryl diester phosphodiesterase